MLVRLNQIDPRTAEGVAGWTTGGLRGTVAYAWPAGAHAFQLQALDRDERGEPVPDGVRRAEVRRAVSSVVASVVRPGDALVVRLDGPFGPGLVPALVLAAESAGYAVSAVQRLGNDAVPPVVSVRFETTVDRLDALCRDERLGLHAGTRLRAYPLPPHLVDPMLDTHDPDDERWRDLIPQAAAVVSTAADLMSVVVWSADLTPDDLRDQLSPRLGATSTPTGRAGYTGRS